MKYSLIKDTIISYCNGCKKTATTDITINNALNEIKDNVFDTKITDLRTTVDSKEKDEKKKKLKAYLFSGQFRKRNKTDLNSYSNICVLDFDHVTNYEKDIELAKKTIHQNEYVFATWLSPSGDGIKALIMFDYSNIANIDRTKYALYHEEAYKEFYNCCFFPYVLDDSGKDVTRLCFTSSDSKLLLKDEINPFYASASIDTVIKTKSKYKKNNRKTIELSEEKVKNIHGKHNNNNRRRIASIYKYLSKHNKSITSTYSDWFKIGQAIANTFSYNIGKEYFLRLCRLDGEKHDEIKSKNLIIQCYSNKITYKGHKNGMPTIIKAAKEVGYIQE